MDKWTCSNLWRIRLENFGLNEELLHHNSKKCGAREDSRESLGLQGDQSSQSQRKSTLNIHWKDWCWSWNSNILATHWEEPTHWKRPSLMLGKIEGESRGQQRMRRLYGMTKSMDLNLSKLWEIVEEREAWWATVHGVTNSQTWLTDWRATTTWARSIAFRSSLFKSG